MLKSRGTLAIQLLLFGSLAAGQTNPPPGTANGLTQGEIRERMFLRRAEESSVANIAAAKLALTQSHDKDVQALALSTQDNHTQMTKGREALFQARGLESPKGVGHAYFTTIERLKALSGSDFDKAYISFVVDEDRVEAFAFFHESLYGNEDVKALALKDAASATQHLQKAEALAQARGLVIAPPKRTLIIPSSSHGN